MAFFADLDFGFGLGWWPRIASRQRCTKTEIALVTACIQVTKYTPVRDICKPLRLFLQRNKAVINNIFYVVICNNISEA